MLDALIPTPRLLELDGVDLTAPPERVWQLLRHEDLARSPLIRALFVVRELPRKLRGDATQLRLTLDELKSSPQRPGFQVLGEDAPRELVVGAIGKVWQAEIPFVHVADAIHYAAFETPGFVKVAWALRVLARGPDACRVDIEVRVDATDEESWQKFKRYFLLIGPGSHLIRRILLGSLARRLSAPEAREEERPLSGDDLLPDAPAQLRHLAERVEGRLPRDSGRDVVEGVSGILAIIAAFATPFLRRARSHWGLTEVDAQRAYPGDELVPEPLWSYTHGIEVAVPSAEAYGWLAQVGADRGAFYSYQWLENLVGCNVRNAERTHPEWEARVGQELVLHPDPKTPRLQIVAVERGRYVLAHAHAEDGDKAAGKPWAASTWLFYVEQLGADRCRVISRFRAACSRDLATRLAFGPTLIEPVGFAMDRRMLLGLKERAERAHAVATTPARGA